MDVDKMPIGFSAAGSYDIAENCRYRQFIDETGLYCGQIKEQSEYLLFTHRRKHINIEERAKQLFIRPCFKHKNL